ncbi:peptidase, partial [Salmonella enterica subsp. enterica serovar Typhimurium]|nr:peptidase [Salmonella enterica subsp. enterica serovar Typhimurium]
MIFSLYLVILVKYPVLNPSVLMSVFPERFASPPR